MFNVASGGDTEHVGQAGFESAGQTVQPFDEGVLEYLELGVLRLDERNVRRDLPTQADTETLAALIHSQSLLQNLTVVAYAKPRPLDGAVKKKGRKIAKVATHGVVAGGRRLRALRLLASRGQLPDTLILCRVVDESRALAVSLAENAGQTPMSVADTVQAFADMVSSGAGIEDIAVAFGITVATVKRRLKLATVSPVLFAAFRAGSMSLDQLMALSVGRTHELQESVWNSASAWDREPKRLKRALLGDVSSAPGLLAYVGRDAYLAAGGVLLQDLFGGQDLQQSEELPDPELMTTLALQKLQQEAETLGAAEGLAWVDAVLQYRSLDPARHCRAPFVEGTPSPEVAATLAELRASLQAVCEQRDALFDFDDESQEDEAQIEALELQEADLQARIETVLQGLRSIPSAVRPLVGAVVAVDPDSGALKVYRGLVRATDRKKLDQLMSAERQGTEPVEGAARPVERDADQQGKGLSEALCRSLTAHRTMALQAVLLDRTDVALAALAHALALPLLYGPSARFVSRSPLEVQASRCAGELERAAPDLAQSSAHGCVEARLTAWRTDLPTEPSDFLAYLLTLSTVRLNDLLVLCAACSLNAVQGTPRPQVADALAVAVGLDMADWWQPGAEQFLARIPKASISAAVAEVGDAELALRIKTLKKGDAVKAAAEALQDKRWLPEVLRAGL